MKLETKNLLSMDVNIDNINLLEEVVEMEELQTRFTPFNTHFNIKLEFYYPNFFL